MKDRSSVFYFSGIVIFALLVCLATTTHAANKTWNGGSGANNNWNTGANWGGSAPSSNDVLFFGGSTRLVNTNNFAANTQFNGITFNSGASSFILRGNVINLGGDVVNNDNSAQTIDLALALVGNFQFNAASSTLSFGGGITSATAGTNILTITGGNATTIGGIIGDGSGTIALTKTGTGNLILNGNNTYSSGTILSNGTITLGHANALGTGSLGMQGGTLELQNGTTHIASSLFGGGGTIRISGNGNNSTLQVGSDNTSTTYGGTLAANGNSGTSLTLVKNGTGTLTLSGVNNASGSSGDVILQVNNGVLRVNGANSLGDGVVTFNGGVLGLGAGDFTRSLGTGGNQVQFTSTGGFAAYTADRNVNLGGSGATLTWNSTASFLQSGETLILGASDADKTVTFQNGIGFNGAVRTIQVDDGSAAVDAILSGVLSGSGSSGFTKTGSGTLSLTGSSANTFAGLATVSSGELDLNKTAGVDAIGAGGLTINSGATAKLLADNQINNNADVTANGTLDLNGHNETIDGLSGSGTVDNKSGAATYTLTVGGNNGTSTFSGSITNSSGKIALTKTGTGTLTVSGANGYTGATTINQGRLAVNGSLGNTAVAINNGGTLGGTGTIAGTVTASAGGRIGAGNSIGNLNVGTLVLNAGSTNDVELGTAGASHTAPGLSDLINVTGNLTLGGTLNLIDNAGANGNGSVGGGSYRIFTYTGTDSGSFAATNHIANLHDVIVDGGAGTGAGQGIFVDLYRLAAANAVTTPVNLGNIHVGGTFGTQALTIQNTAANDGFSEKLNASFGTLTGGASINNGSINLLSGGASDNTSMVVGLGNASTATAGGKSGTALLNLNSDGTGTSGWGITALAGQTITVTGNVYRLAAPNTLTTPVNLGNVRVGGSFATQAVTIRNTAANDGFSEKLDASFGALTGDASTNNGSISLLGPNTTNNTSMIVGLGNADTATVGAKSGTVLVNLTSDGSGTSGLGLTGLAGQTITINGAVYRLAAANTIGGLTFGNYHVGDVVTQQALTLQNTAANDGFSEKLNGKFGTITGSLTTNGSVNLLSAGSTDSSSLLVGINTATAGAKGGTVVVNLTSDGTGTSGLSASNLTAQTVNITAGSVYRLAAANTLPTPIGFGNIHVGDTFGTRALVITNTAANDGFSEKLDVSFGTITGDASINNGTINLLGPTTRDNTSMVVGLDNANTAIAGGKSGTVVLNLTSDGTGTSGLGLTGLSGQTITVNGNVYRFAAPNSISNVTFGGNYRLGQAVAQQALVLQNTAANDGFSEKLKATFGTITGGITTNGSVNLLAAGATDNTHLLVGLNTATVGSKSGTVLVNLVSDGSGTSGLGTSNLPSQLINVTAGNVYRLAAANTIGGLTFSGNHHIGDVVQQALILQNTAASDGFSEMLDASFGTITGGLTTNGSVSLLAPGSTDNTSLIVGLNTATVGSKSGTVKVNLTSDGTGTSGLSASNLTAQTINITAGTVYRLASANTVVTPINLGTIHAGGSFGTQSLSITNTAANDGFSEKLTASFGAPSAGITASGSFNLLNPGSRNTSMVVGISDNTAGTKSGTVSLNLTSDGSGTSGLGTTILTPQIITVNGIVYSGQGVWNVNGSGNWSDSTKWTADGGVPGIDGVLSISDSAFFGNALASSGRTVSLNGTSPKLAGITFSNASFSYTIAQGSGGSLILSNSPVVTVADGSHTISAPIVLSNNTLFTMTDLADQLLISGNITGNGNLTETGNGTLILSGTNSYGATLISSGTLQIGNGGASGSLGNGAVTNNASLVFNRSGNFTVANAIRGSGSFAHFGTGTLTLNAANSYSGDTTVSNGTLKGGAANSISPNSVMTVVAGATLDVNGFDQTVGGLSGGGTVTRASSGAPTTFTIDNSGDHNFTGVINGKLDVVKQGAGVQTFSGTSANTFQNQTTVNEGELDLGKSVGVDAIPNNLIIGDGVGGVNADIVRLLANSQIDNASIVTINSSGLFDLNGYNEGIGTLINSGNVALGGGALAGTTLSNALAGTITGPGIFSNALINAGTLVVTNGTLSVLQGWNNNGTVAMRGGTLAGSTVTNLAARDLTGSGIVSNTIVNNGFVTATNGTLQLAGLGGGTGNYRAGGGATMVFAGNGTLGSLSNEAGSTVQLLGSITNGASFVNQSSFQLLGGTYSSTMAVTNLASSTVGNFGTFDATLVNLGTVHVTNGTMNFTKGIVQSAGSTLNVENAILNAGHAWTNSAGATVNLFNGTIAGSLFANEGLLYGGGLVSAPFINYGTVTHVGGGITFNSVVTNTGGGTLDLDGVTNNFSGSLVNNGNIHINGGTINGPKFQNNGSFNGHGNINSATHNVGNMNVSGGKTTFVGDVTNAAIFTVTETVAVFSNNFVNLGTYISDPSTNIFVGDYTLGPNASLIGGAGDVFEFQRNFYNDSTNATLFDLALCTVTFTGGGVHTNTLAAMNVGSNLYQGAYVYGTLSLGSTSDQIQFFSGGGGGDALYIRNLDLLGDTNNVANLFAPTGVTLYYLAGEHNTFNNYLLGQTYTLNGGGTLMAAIPEPTSLLLLLAGLTVVTRRLAMRR